MDAFPAYVPLAGRTVVIAGSGEAAEAKARLFEGSPAVVVRAAGDEAAAAATYQGAALAFVASDDEAFVQAAVAAARAAHVLVNVPDRPELCDFTTPALVDRGEVVAAVGTGGGSPMLATLLRTDLEARIPPGAGRVAALFRRHQAAVREALPDLPRRRAFLRAALDGPAAAAAMAGDMDEAGRLLLAALAQGQAGQGGVQFVLAGGPAELLTLQAVRALASADVVAADAGVERAVLALARRDAPRLSPREAGLERLAQLAAEGSRVVRVVAAKSAGDEAAALSAAGVRVTVLPAVL